MDIEELGSLSAQMAICGYFSAREASEVADVIVTPYQSILSEATRESLGISLYNKVVLFDEAHNIMETISSMSNITVTKA